MKKQNPKFTTLTRLNRLVDQGGIVLIQAFDDGTTFILDEFRNLADGEDYFDPEAEEYFVKGKLCRIVAYVKEMPEHIPWSAIDKIFVAEEVEIK
jgi:hypothetical protein